MNIIKLKIIDVKKICSYIAEYYEKLKPIVDETYKAESLEIKNIINEYPNKLEQIQDKLSEIDKISSLADKDASFNHIETILNNFHEMESLFININNICAIFDNYEMRPENLHESYLSETYKLDTSEALEKLLSMHNKFKNKYKNEDEKIISEIGQIIIKLIFNLHPINDATPKELLTCIRKIRDIFHTMPNIVKLYAYYVQKLMNDINEYVKITQNNNKYEMKNVIFYLIEFTEQDKNFILTSEDKKNKLSKTNPSLKRFSFIPISDTMGIKELFKTLLKLEISGKVNLESIAKSFNCTFIISNKITYNPIKYDISKLMDIKYKQPETYGINKTFQLKTKTIDELPHEKWNFSYEIISPSKINWNDQDIDLNEKVKAMKFYVLESLDGVNYRCMAPWMSANNIGLPFFRVKHLINYIFNDHYPTRIFDYQKNAIRNTIPNMFLMKKLPLDLLLEESKQVDSQIIRNNIFIKIVDKFTKKLNKIKNTDDFLDAIHDPEFEEIFINIVLKMYNRSNISDLNKFPVAELLVSYVNNLQKITRTFMKELHDNYFRDQLKDFKEKKEIKHKFENILKRTLENIISNKTNIYQELNYKNLLLNFN